jgi:pimeloyl-ACP methyl ester carboxylesterase
VRQRSRKLVSVYKSPKARQSLLEYYDRVIANWPIPCDECYLDTGCGRTHVLECGNRDASPLVLFHGTGNNSLMWRFNVEGLGEHFMLYLIDTVNDPGKSEATTTFKAATDYARWTTEVLDALGLDRANLVGHSKGGWVVLNTTISAPERVKRIALIAPAVGINPKLSRNFIRRSLRVGMFPRRKNVISYLRYMSGPDAQVNTDYAEYLSNVIRGTRQRIIKHRRFTDDELAGIKAPVLLAFGDHEVSVDYRSVIARQVDNPEPGCSDRARHGTRSPGREAGHNQ